MFVQPKRKPGQPRGRKKAKIVTWQERAKKSYVRHPKIGTEKVGSPGAMPTPVAVTVGRGLL